MFAKYLEATEVLQGKQAGGFHLCALSKPHYHLLVTPRKELTHWSVNSNFCDCCPGVSPKHLIWRPTRVCSCDLTGLCMLVYFKNCLQRVWLSVSRRQGSD